MDGNIDYLLLEPLKSHNIFWNINQGYILILITYQLREGNAEFKGIHRKGSTKNKKYAENVSSVLYISSLRDAPTSLCGSSITICEIRFYYPERPHEIRTSSVSVQTVF